MRLLKQPIALVCQITCHHLLNSLTAEVLSTNFDDLLHRLGQSGFKSPLVFVPRRPLLIHAITDLNSVNQLHKSFKRSDNTAQVL